MPEFIKDSLQNNLQNQRKVVLIASVGIIVFLLIASTVTFQSGLFSKLFPRLFSKASASTGWYQLQHDAQHTGSTAVNVPPDYEVAWAWMDKSHIVKNFVSAPDKSLNDGFEQGYQQNVIFSSQVQPIIADGKAYFGAMNGTLYAVDALTGDNRWDFTSGGPILSTAAYDQAVVVFGSMDGKIYGLDATTGAKKWEYQTGAGINAAPVIANNTVYIGSRDGNFYAFDVLTGNKKWQYATRVNPVDINSIQNQAPVFAAAAISEDGSTVFFGAENMFFYALNTLDGSEKWVSQKMVGQSFAFGWPVVTGDKIIVRTLSSLKGPEVGADDSVPLIESVLDGLPADPTIAEEKSAILNWLQQNPYQKSMYVFNISDGTEPYQVAMARVASNNYTSYPPVIDQTGNVLTYWRSKVATFFRNQASFGSDYCSDLSIMDMTNGDRSKINIALPDNSRVVCPELDNGFQTTIGGDYLYLFQPYRGSRVVNIKTGSNRGISAVMAKNDCGSARGGTFDGDKTAQVVYYGNDSAVMPTPCEAAIPGDTRPPVAYNSALGYSGVVVASVNNTPMLFLNETIAYAMVAVRPKSGTPTLAPSVMPSPSPTATNGLTLQINSSADDVHEVDSGLVSNGITLRMGGCGSPSICTAGFRFTNVTVPKGAKITSSKLQVIPSVSNQWTQLDYIINGENAGNSAIFASATKPSQRTLTTASVNHSDSVQWLGVTPVNLDEMNTIIQEIVNRSDWISGNSLSVVIRATSPSGFGAKFIHSFDGSSMDAPKLIITYE